MGLILYELFAEKKAFHQTKLDSEVKKMLKEMHDNGTLYFDMNDKLKESDKNI